MCARACVCVRVGIMFPVLLSWNRPPTRKTNRRTTGSPDRRRRTYTQLPPKSTLPKSSQNRTCCYQRFGEIPAQLTCCHRVKDNIEEGFDAETLRSVVKMLPQVNRSVVRKHSRFEIKYQRLLIWTAAALCGGLYLQLFYRELL